MEREAYAEGVPLACASGSNAPARVRVPRSLTRAAQGCRRSHPAARSRTRAAPSHRERCHELPPFARNPHAGCMLRVEEAVPRIQELLRSAPGDIEVVAWDDGEIAA